MKNHGLEVEVQLSYQDFSVFEHYCQKNQINIIEVNYQEVVKCLIEVLFDEKAKIDYEIEKKQFNIQKMEVLKEKNIRKN